MKKGRKKNREEIFAIMVHLSNLHRAVMEDVFEGKKV
jgi:hypothetical protein